MDDKQIIDLYFDRSQHAAEAVAAMFGTSTSQTHESRLYDPWEVVDADGKKLIPDGPVPCKLRINEHPNGGVTIEIEEFEIPMQGVNIAPAACQVTQSGKTFTLSGEGNVKVGDNSIDYSHEGTIEKGNMDLTITVPLIPMLVEPQIVFKGEKEK